ncbi:hypothetical protein KSP39_PZI023883 [Platanthera zijinensis]|uniref:Uncharacterized protein n=1 Tax=Platanthera zijinensis TaxID=2320716 RepID=A0AAP0ATL2_9ASPA
MLRRKLRSRGSMARPPSPASEQRLPPSLHLLRAEAPSRLLLLHMLRSSRHPLLQMPLRHPSPLPPVPLRRTTIPMPSLRFPFPDLLLLLPHRSARG